MFRRIDKVIGTKDYVNFRLTGRVATDYSYASGCGVYDLFGGKYSERTAGGRRLVAGSVAGDRAVDRRAGAAHRAKRPRRWGFRGTLQVACGGVDNSCMALGTRCFREGRTYASLGSSMWIASSSATPLLEERSKPYVFTHVVPGMFASALAIFSGGTSLRWVRDHLCANLVEQARIDGRDPYDVMTALAEQSPVGSRKLLFNPSLAGGSSLDASPAIRGAFLGLDLGHTQADMVRATLEGIALNLRLVLDELRRLGKVGRDMVVVGGGSRSPLWRQILADALQVDIVKTNVGQEAGALGAAAVAAVAVGLWDDFSRVDQLHHVESVTRPDPTNMDVYDKLLPVFRQASLDQARLGDALAATNI